MLINRDSDRVCPSFMSTRTREKRHARRNGDAVQLVDAAEVNCLSRAHDRRLKT